MYTLNQLISKLKSIAVSHKQLNSFGFGDAWEIGSGRLLYGGKPYDGGMSASPIYPLMWANVVSNTINTNQCTLSIQLIFCDLVFKNESNENDVLSDLNTVAIDVYKMIDYEAFSMQKYLIDGAPSLIPFTEKFDDEVSGWVMNISLRIPMSYSNCAIPADDVPDEILADANCPVYNVVDGGFNSINSTNLING